MIGAEILAALIAALVSIASVAVNYIVSRQTHAHEQQLRVHELSSLEARLTTELNAKRDEWQAQLLLQERQWQESFRADLRRSLAQESTLELVRLRLALYGQIWAILKPTSRYEWRNIQQPKDITKRLVTSLTDIAHGQVGMIMSERSRHLLTYFRQGCGAFLRDEIPADDLIHRSHLLKHSLRSDIGITTYEYESDLLAIANSLGRVEDWEQPAALNLQPQITLTPIDKHSTSPEKLACQSDPDEKRHVSEDREKREKRVE